MKLHAGEIAALGVLVAGIGLALAGFWLASSILSDHNVMQQKNGQLLEKIVEVQGVCRNVLEGQ